MNRKIIAATAALGIVMGLAACDNFQSPQDETVETAPEPMEPMAPAAEDMAAPAAAPAATDTPPDNTTLPPERRTSEESVKPESETLFY